MELSSSDREYLNGLETRSLTMILLSQTYMGKCRFVNELLTDVWSLDTSVSDFLRIIRIKIEVYFHSIIEINHFIHLESSNKWCHYASYRNLPNG